jgi:predicted RNA-binding protein with PIN domain
MRLLRQLERDNDAMALLIDGYNLLHVTEIFGGAGAGTELHRTRMALLDFLAGAIGERERRQTAIVFDAAGAPPGLPSSLVHNDIQVHFARRHSDADELIEELLERHPAPRGLLVVSSDHRVQRAARHHGASYIDSDQWYAELRAAREREPDERGPSCAKPEREVGKDEITYWVDEFADAPPDDSATSPFPPGYGDDVTEDE